MADSARDPESGGFRGYIPTLDGWRAVAIVAVMAHHLLVGRFAPDGAYPSALLNQLQAQGARGVDVFFALSGLLITSRLLEERRRSGQISLKAFYIRRAFRILPPYWLYLAALAALAAAGIVQVSRDEWLGCLFFYRNYIAQGVDGWFTSHFWSLSVEEHFYLFWPALVWLLWRRQSLMVALVLSIGVEAWRRVDHALHLVPVAGMGRTDLRIDALLWGSIVALIIEVPAVKGLVARLTRGWLWVLMAAGLAVLGFRYVPLTATWQAVLWPLVVVGTALNPGSRFARLLETAPLRWIGRLSYSLYLWQQLFLTPAWRGQEALSLAATFGCAAASFYWLERPSIGIGTTMAKRLNQPNSSA